MDTNFYAFRDIDAKRANNMCHEFDDDMLVVWKEITDAILMGKTYETVVWNLRQRDLVRLKLEKLGYTCKLEHGNGPGSAFADGLTIKWKEVNQHDIQIVRKVVQREDS